MDATTRVDLQRPSRWLDQYLLRIGEYLFAEADDDARSRGWDVTVGGRGLTRTYRDPRIGRLVPCRACDGCEDVRAPACATCRGIGRILPRAQAVAAVAVGVAVAVAGER
jgi:hypothetical protein